MLNLWQGIGRCGKDPLVKYTQDGTAVTNFSIACSKKFKDKNGEQKETTFWGDCVAWGKLAEIVGEYIKKGNLIHVSGELQTRKWKDQQGADRYTTEVVATTVQNLSPRNTDTDNRNTDQHQGTGEDCPF